VFSLDDGIKSILMNLQNSPGCGVLKTPSHIVSVHVEIAEDEWEFIDTNPNSTRETEWARR
jgi:predicted secreted protein